MTHRRSWLLLRSINNRNPKGTYHSWEYIHLIYFVLRVSQPAARSWIVSVPGTGTQLIALLLFFFSTPFIRWMSPFFFSLHPNPKSQIRGHTVGSSPPCPLRSYAFHFYLEKTAAHSSFCPRRLASNFEGSTRFHETGNTCGNASIAWQSTSRDHIILISMVPYTPGTTQL